MEPKNRYEWVLTMSKGDDVVLTENQYEYYKENRENGTIFFADCEVNPSFVVSSERRPARIIKDKYPCKTCGTCGRVKKDNLFVECPDCQGSGVKFI